MPLPSSSRLRLWPCDSLGAAALLALSVFLGSPLAAHATQDDLRLSFSDGDRLLQGNPESGVRFLSAALAEVSVAIYPLGGDYHRWHGQLWGDVAIVAFGPVALWRFGLSMQTVADYGNAIHFRLTRLYYDAATGVDFRVGKGVLSVGYRHRCTHGADAAVPGRILIRSGLDLAWRMQHRIGRVQLRGEAVGQLTIAGQNQDLGFQPRGVLYTVGGVTVDLVGRLGLIGSAGIGVAVVGRGGGEGDDWGIATPADEYFAVPLPAAAVGLRLQGNGLTGRLLLHYQRLMDSGNTAVTQAVDLLAMRVEFVWTGARRDDPAPVEEAVEVPKVEEPVPPQ